MIEEERKGKAVNRAMEGWKKVSYKERRHKKEPKNKWKRKGKKGR